MDCNHALIDILSHNKAASQRFHTVSVKETCQGLEQSSALWLGSYQIPQLTYPMTLISPNQLNTRCILLICAHFIHLSREIITILGRVLICASDALDCVVILAQAWYAPHPNSPLGIASTWMLKVSPYVCEGTSGCWDWNFERDPKLRVCCALKKLGVCWEGQSWVLNFFSIY